MRSINKPPSAGWACAIIALKELLIFTIFIYFVSPNERHSSDYRGCPSTHFPRLGIGQQTRAIFLEDSCLLERLGRAGDQM
jgi:hypothetical protein